MNRPKLFFDTNVCDKLLQEPYVGRLHEIKHRIKKEYRLVVSPETLIELLDTIKGGDGQFFEFDKKRLAVATDSSALSFLDFPAEFALRKSLGIVRPAAFGPVDFKRCYRVIRSATKRSDLFGGRVPWRDKEFVFDPAIIEQQQQAGKESHQEWIKKGMSRGYTYPPTDVWAAKFAIDLEVDITPEQATKLGNDLAAAYDFRKSGFEIAKANPNYRPDKRDGDWVDGQQLIYLCDPLMNMVTDERAIKNKCSGSLQSERVLLLADFVQNHLGIKV